MKKADTRLVTASDVAHLRKSWKEIAEVLNGDSVWQIHRDVIVRATAIGRAQCDDTGRITTHLKQQPEKLQVSQACTWRFQPI